MTQMGLEKSAKNNNKGEEESNDEMEIEFQNQ